MCLVSKKLLERTDYFKSKLRQHEKYLHKNPAAGIRVVEWPGLEAILKIIQFQHQRHGQGCPPLDQVFQDSILRNAVKSPQGLPFSRLNKASFFRKKAGSKTTYDSNLRDGWL